MNNHQRGIYQPLVDNIPVYDLSDDESEDGERSRLPLMIVVGLIVMAAFTGVVWLAYNQGVERGRSGTIVIAAPEGPVRTKPADAGGENALTGLNVYKAPESPDAIAKSSKLASNPAPAVAAPPPAPSVREAPQVRLNPSTPAVTPATQAKVEPPKPVAPPPQVASTPAPVQAVPASAPVRSPTPVPVPAALSAPAPAPVQTASAAAATPAASVPGAAGWVLQLGSYENADLANSSWVGFKKRFEEVLGDQSNDVQRADLGARGIFFRLRAGHYTDKGEAAAACQKLKALGGNCIVAAQ